jgi:hypothetical protein
MLPLGIANHAAKRKNSLALSSIWFLLHRLWSSGTMWTLATATTLAFSGNMSQAKT